MFLIISIFISVPCVGIAAGQNAYEKGLTNFGYNTSYAEASKDFVQSATVTDTSYVENLSAGKVFNNPQGANFTSIYTSDPTTTLFRADMIAYLNIAGAIYVLIHSLILRRKLVKTSSQLDNMVSPKDYGLIVRNIPKDTTAEDLKKTIEEQFKTFDIQIEYVNLCYDISEMIGLGEKIHLHSKELAHYRLYLQRELKKKNLSK